MTETLQPPSLIGGQTDKSSNLPNRVQRYSDFDNYLFVKSGGHETRCHWIAGTIKSVSFSQFQELCESLLLLPGDKITWSPEVPIKNGIFWLNSARSSSGINIGWNNKTEDKQFHGFVSVSGSVLDGLSALEGWSLISMLQKFGLKFTRIDVVFIDFDRRLFPEQVNEFCKAGLLRGPRKFAFLEGDTVYAEGLGILINRGCTLTIGSRQSEKFLRIYDAAWLHKSKSIRWELEMKRATAVLFADRLTGFFEKQSYDSLLENQGVLEQFVNATIFGNFTFVGVDYITETHTDRREILPAWADFLDYACSGETIKTAPARPITTFAKKLNWLHRQVARSIAVVRAALQEKFNDWLRQFLLVGEKKMSEFDDAYIDYLRYFMDNCDLYRDDVLVV
jgi:hypothetical protein